MNTFKPIAPIEPDEEFDPDAYEAMIAAIERMTGETSNVELEEAFNPNQARFPKGHPKAGQWRPKLVTGAGRVAPGHLERDMLNLMADIAVAHDAHGDHQPESQIRAIGEQVEKVALRYSARKTYEKRLTDIRAERKTIQDRMWGEWEKASPGMTPEEWKDADPKDFLLPGEQARLIDLADEEIRTARQRDFADRDAMLGVLQRIRPMGGTLKQAADPYEIPFGSEIRREYAGKGNEEAMKRDLNANLKQALKVIPKAWLDDTNSKGEMSWLFSTDRAWASTREAAGGEPDEFKDARDEFTRLGEQGYKFLGVHRKQDTFLMFRKPDSNDVIALRGQDGTIVTGVGDYADTPLVLDARGEMSLPGYATRPTTAQERKSIKAMKNLPPPRREPGSGGAMGPDWDPHKEMREGVKRYESEGWTFVGLRGKWATLRKDGEQISLNWAGQPMSGGQVGQGGKEDPLPPLNPYGQVPLPPIPVRFNTQIKIDPREKAILLHEISHRLEVVYGEENKAGYNPISAVTHAWRARRTRGERSQNLDDLYPNADYRDDEIAYPDEFVDAYIGKLYPGQATEVLSMGMDMLWFPRYSERDINQDPEMRQLILGLQATL